MGLCSVSLLAWHAVLGAGLPTLGLMRMQGPVPSHCSPLCPSGWLLPERGDGNCKGAKPREGNGIRHPGEWDNFILGGAMP